MRVGLAACLLLWRGAAAQTPSADAMAANSAAAGSVQELAGPSRAARQGAAMMQPAMAESDGDGTASALVPAIVFAPGSAKLTPSATRILDDLGQSLAAPELAVDRFRVEAHADGRGAPDANRDLANRDLANRRAQAVVAYLEQNCGIAGARLEALASARPLGRGGRRVRIVNLGP